MNRLILLAIPALLAVACGDNATPQDGDAMPPAIDAMPDARLDSLAPCLDRPTDLARPPVGQLPCDLLPPGFGS